MFDPENEEMEDLQSDEPLKEESVSLEGLSQAFAEAMKGASKDSVHDDGCVESEGKQSSADADQAAAEDDTEENPESLPPSYADESDEEEHCPISPQSILEAMLFVGNAENRPLTSRQAADLMRGVESEEIPELVGRLNNRYEANGCPYKIFSEGAGYRLKLCERFDALRNKIYGRVREARLSQAAVDVLAIVAYRQPITGEEVGRLRNKPCRHILSQLVRRRLLQIEWPADKSGKPLYRTTNRFLELFGLDNIEELPQSEDVAT